MKATRWGTFIALAIGSVILAGCASPGTATQSASASASGDPNGPITIYAPMSDTRAAFVKAQAQSDLGMEVNIVTGAAGDLSSRITAEKANPQADAVVGLGESILNQLSAAGDLQPYTPAWSDLIPTEFRSTDTNFTLSTQTPIVISYNTAVMNASDAPTSWEDLAKPEYKDKFVFPSITGQTGQAAAVGILWRYTDATTGDVSQDGWDVLSAVLKNAKQLASGQSFDWSEVKNGDLPIVVNWLGGIQTGEKDNGLTLQVIDTTDGTPFVSTGIAEVSGATNTAATQRFIDWFGSADFQVKYVNATNNDTPLNTDALTQLPSAEAAISQVQKQDIDWSVVTPHLTDWLQKIQLDILD